MSRERLIDDAQNLFDRGHRAFSDGAFQEAIDCFSRAIKLRPDVAAGYRYRAYAYLELGDRVRALNDLDQAIRLKPDDVQSQADRAAELFAQKQFDLAIADCDRVLKQDSGRAPMYGLRGRCHAERGDSESALRDYASAMAGDPENAPRYLLWRAQLRLDCEDYAAARADCDEALRLDPESAEGYHLRGMVEQQDENPEGAIADFSEALRREASHSWARLGRAICNLELKEYDEVLKDCDVAVRELPTIPRCYDVRGTARRALGNLEGALADFNESVRLAPQSVMPYNYRAGVHYAKGEYTAAIHDHMEALKRDPRQAGTFNQLAWIWATAPELEVRNGERARECATRACELTEWSEPGFLDTLAAACAECGEFEDAVKWQRKAMDQISDPVRLADYRSRLEMYQDRKPIRVDGLE